MSFFIPYIPQFPLSEFVECFWYVKGPLHYKREKILPIGTIDLMINLGSPYKVVDKTNPEKFKLNKYFWIAGFQTEYLLIEATAAETNMIGVRFKPEGAYAFFNFPISELNNQTVAMDLIWGRFIAEVRERLLASENLSDRFKLLETMLLRNRKRCCSEK